MSSSNVIISGVAHGFGSDQWRWVSGLSTDAKIALADNTALVICERPFSDSLGDWYVVTNQRKSRYNHRLPDSVEREIINRFLKTSGSEVTK